jgi:hypothetical protein
MTWPTLTRIEAGVTRYFTDTATINRPGSASDSEGNPTKVLSPIWTGSGYLGLPSASERQIAAQLGQRLDAVFSMPVEDISLGDQVTVRDKTYKVIASEDRRVRLALYLQVTA